MLYSNIRDYKAETVALQEKLGAIVSEMNAAEYTEKIQKIQASLEKSQPSLMFYGIYNAGKSTLLNAIFGKEVASVNDIPETHKVTLYEWGKYTLADTPGLNGPPEDEIITAAEVRKHDIIMFVIDDSDNFDSDVITKKIIEILETRKPCIIVINRKNDSDREKIIAIKAKMNKNIQTLSTVTQAFEFVDVDAAMALKAKKEQKNILLDNSNIKELEYCISNKLTLVDSVKLLCVPIELMIELCYELKLAIKDEIEDGDSKNLYKLKERMLQVKEQVIQEFTISLNHMIDRYSDEIYSKASMNKQSDINEDVYAHQVQELVQKYMDKFSHEGNLALSRFQEECRMNLNLVNIPEISGSSKLYSNKEEKDGVDDVLDALEKIPIIIRPIPTPIPIPLPVLIGLVKVLKKWIFGSGKNDHIDVEEYNREQEEYAQKRTMALQELKNQIAVQMKDYRESIVKSFTEQLENAYCKSAEDIDSTLNSMGEKNQNRVKKHEDIADIENRAIRLLNEIRDGKLSI